MNPAAPQTVEFLKLCSKTKMISFHYYNRSMKFFASSITGIDDEHVEWCKRNYELSGKLFRNDYSSVCMALYTQLTPRQRLYHYFEKDGIDCFVREGSMVAKYVDIRQPFSKGGLKKMWS